jgi:AhpC/TSA family
MLRRPYHATLEFALLMVLSAATQASAEDKQADPAAEKAARDALVKFDKNWKDYTNEPNFGDPRWKLKMETLVKLAKAGRAAIPLLEQAAKEDSTWAAHTRELATHVLGVARDRPAVRDALANYDLSRMDVAKEGKQAPDFTLTDAAGRSYRLSDYRGKKTIVVTFILQDI